MSALRELSPRERQIAALMGQGLMNKEIAFELGLTEGTIKAYASRLYMKRPDMGRRYGAAKLAARDHERKLAIRLNGWIAANGYRLSAEALTEIKGIMGDMVAKVLQ